MALLRAGACRQARGGEGVTGGGCRWAGGVHKARRRPCLQVVHTHMYCVRLLRAHVCGGGCCRAEEVEAGSRAQRLQAAALQQHVAAWQDRAAEAEQREAQASPCVCGCACLLTCMQARMCVCACMSACMHVYVYCS